MGRGAPDGVDGGSLNPLDGADLGHPALLLVHLLDAGQGAAEAQVRQLLDIPHQQASASGHLAKSGTQSLVSSK